MYGFRELSTLVVAVMALVISAIPKTAWTFVFTRRYLRVPVDAPCRARSLRCTVQEYNFPRRCGLCKIRYPIRTLSRFHSSDRSQVTPETLVLLLSLSLFSLPAQPGTSSTAPVLPWAAARARFPWSCLALTACGQVHVAFFQRSGMNDVLVSWVKSISGKTSQGFVPLLGILSTLTAELTSKDKGVSFLLPTLDAIVSVASCGKPAVRHAVNDAKEGPPYS
ncbi:uncharacterized protein LOC119403383 [Rhipicephalus sanguineus]|uniref:uncharacterized protein LOC119403383 n=1 Tax=Rhipicephalus sanguineus TaxID=34632 RepID=UPI0020C2CED1|nr:uncharacterized protein LOC119403383 [Rhipicephalus sanguineus]